MRKKEKVIQAFQEFVKEHYYSDREFKTQEIEHSIEKKTGFALTWNIADYSIKEGDTESDRTNKFLIHTRYSYYKILK